MEKIIFRGFYESKNGTKTITVDGKQIKGEWVYWNVFGKLTNADGEEQIHERTIDSGVMWKYDRAEQLPIVENTIGQYIDMTDKNNIGIFSEDIVLVNGKYVRYILYSGTHTAFCRFRYAGKDAAECLGALGKGYNNYNYDFKVIGNIWENPELLQEKKL